MLNKIIKLIGKEKGPTSIILVGVHGNERCGIDALYNILPKIKIENGAVYFGYGNPRAILQNKRFTEANLNRMFKIDSLLSNADKKSYEYSRAQFLKKYLNKSDALLDIHASLIKNSKPFVICESNAKKITKYLPIKFVVSGFDRIEPGGTDYYMNKKGKIGICVECGYIADTQSIKLAERSILSFLKTRGHIAGNERLTNQVHFIMKTIYLTKTNKFVLKKHFKNFETVSKGQIIGYDGGKAVVAKKEGIILFAHNRDKIGSEAFLFGKKKSLNTQGLSLHNSKKI